MPSTIWRWNSTNAMNSGSAPTRDSAITWAYWAP